MSFSSYLLEITRENLKIIDGYMSKNNLAVDLKVRVKKYLEFIWNRGPQTSEREQKLLLNLPSSLQEEILLQSQGKFLKEFAILKDNFSEDFINRIALKLHPVTYAPKDIIYKVFAEISRSFINFIK